MRYFCVVGLTTIAATTMDASGAGEQQALQCVPAAARHHHVNEEVLRSILRIESRNSPTATNRNSDQSLDIGIGGTNSVHWPELLKYGVYPQHLLDPCTSIFTTAWLLAKAVRRHGDTWYGYAAFHSTTPYYNARYQVLLHNDLVQRGVKTGSLLPVPPLTPSRAGPVAATPVPSAGRGR